MDAYWIITAFVVIDTLMERLGHRTHRMHEEKCFFLRDSELQDG